MASTEFPVSFVQPWLDTLKASQATQIDDFPNYHVFNPHALFSSSVLRQFHVGTGFTIFSRALLPAMLQACRSIHFVTCYWAESPSLDAFKKTLEELAALRREAGVSHRLRIFIGFSSRGLFQKLFHTSSRDGYIYPPSQWPDLGLPNEGLLRDARIDLTVKSLFFTPLSVMHPKYLVVDEGRAWVPSCNVSWERWFEGCIALEGDVVAKLLTFHERVWGSGAWSSFGDEQSNAPDEEMGARLNQQAPPTCPDDDSSAAQSCVFRTSQPVPTLFLPSSHHRNPRFSIFPFLSQTQPPVTPLNAALLTLFEDAQTQITVLTPNVTSWPALDALLAALSRGVDVEIRTSRDMMFIEQLVTAGTWTSRCLDQFVRKYERLVEARRTSQDAEVTSAEPGCLEIFYYKESSARKGREDEPVVSHFKATMVDRQFVMLGSGNMDRASWWTSQEIGLLFYLRDFEGSTVWESVLKNRTETFYSSRHRPRRS